MARIKRTRRYFSPEFKRHVVTEHLVGGATQAALSRRYQLARHLIPDWIEAYREGRLSDMPSDRDYRALEARNRELERLVGKLTLEVQLLKKLEVLPPVRLKGNGLLASGGRTTPPSLRAAE